MSEDLDMSNAFGRMFVYIIGIFAQFEREQISERTISGLMEKANQGKYPFGRVPFGYTKLEDHTVVVNEEEKELLLEMFDLFVHKFKSVEFIEGYAKERGIDFGNPITRFSNTIYLEYVNVPIDSDNRFDICKPILTEENIESLEYRKHHNQLHYGYKHDYKFRNKVFINGKNAKHTKKFKNGKTYNYYYYVKGCPYINEKDLEKFVKRQMEKDEERREQKISGLISDLAYELAIGSITKKEFDSKYKTILKNDSRTKWNEKKIYVKAYIENKKKYIEYKLE